MINGSCVGNASAGYRTDAFIKPQVCVGHDNLLDYQFIVSLP